MIECGERHMWWAVTPAGEVVEAAGFATSTPYTWWVPSLGFQLTKGIELFDTQEKANKAAIDFIDSKVQLLSSQRKRLQTAGTPRVTDEEFEAALKVGADLSAENTIDKFHSEIFRTRILAIHEARRARGREVLLDARVKDLEHWMKDVVQILEPCVCGAPADCKRCTLLRRRRELIGG